MKHKPSPALLLLLAAVYNAGRRQGRADLLALLEEQARERGAFANALMRAMSGR